MIRPFARCAATWTAVVMLSLCTRAEACPEGSPAASGCGPTCSQSTSTPPSHAARGGDPFPVTMLDSFFVPAKMIIRPSSFVRWTNEGLDVHTATREGMFDSGLVDPGAVFDFEFTSLTAGFAYSYTCYLHVGMDGVIYVARYGDANLDGNVNLEDFNIFASNFGTSGPPWEGGDFNEDGAVNLEDFNLLAANFGRQIEPAAMSLVLDFGTSVPEPAMMTPLAPAAMMLARRSRRKNFNHE